MSETQKHSCVQIVIVASHEVIFTNDLTRWLDEIGPATVERHPTTVRTNGSGENPSLSSGAYVPHPHLLE